MKRDPALVPLTHDHHHALAQARRLRTAASGDAATRRDGAAAFLDFFERETIPHFREEEELVFPLLVDVSEAVPELLASVLAEHIQIHCLVRRLRRALENDELRAADLLGVGERLEAHVRLEEKQLFPLIEQVVPASLLGELTLPLRRRGDGGQEPAGAADVPG